MTKIASPAIERQPRESNDHFAVRVAAAKGILPAAPDFSKDTHRAWRKALANIESLVKARDLKGLKADPMQPASSSRVILCRYRDNAIAALEVKAARKAPAKAKAPARKAAKGKAKG